MDNLKSDLKSVQGVIADLLGRVGDLSASSWRFPERLAASLDPLQILKERDRENEGLVDNRTLLLELLVDRLIFLLQCCVRFSETSQGQKASSLPLTLGSVVKKFSRKLQQDQSTLRQAKEQLCARDERIASLKSSVADLQSTAIHQSSSSMDSIAVNQSPSSTRLDPATTRVPYEALGTLKLNRLSSSSSGDTLTQHSSNTTSISTSTVDTKSTTVLLPPQGTSVSTQTTETAFAVCLKCSDTHRALVELAQCVGEATSSHRLSYSLGGVDWAGLASVGGLDIGKWEECFRSDMEGLSGHATELETRVCELGDQLQDQREVTVRLEGEIESQIAQINSLQTTIEEVRERGAKSLARTQHDLSEQLRELRDSCSLLESTNSKVREELASSQQQEASLKSKLVDIEHKRTEIQREIQSLQSREVGLLSCQQSLEKELEVATVEKLKYKEQLDHSQLELAKTRIVSQSMEKKNKALVSKQSALLSRLGELDEECGELRGRLCEVESERRALGEEVATIHTQCEQLRGELDHVKDKLTQSLVEGEQLRDLCSSLEVEVRDTRDRLDEEAERCRLLMDYPFMKQTSDGYVQHIRSLSARDSQRQISANTVRILLLEEQNSELREKGLKEARERGSYSAGQLHRPVKMWRDGLLTQVHSEQSTAKQASRSISNQTILPSTHSPPHRPPTQSPPHRSSSSGSYKGRLGHLVTAIADHRSTEGDSQ